MHDERSLDTARIARVVQQLADRPDARELLDEYLAGLAMPHSQSEDLARAVGIEPSGGRHDLVLQVRLHLTGGA